MARRLRPPREDVENLTDLARGAIDSPECRIAVAPGIDGRPAEERRTSDAPDGSAVRIDGWPPPRTTFHGAIYPIVTSQPPMPPTKPVGQPGPGFELQFVHGTGSTRLWAVSDDGSWLAQTQDDRLLVQSTALSLDVEPSTIYRSRRALLTYSVARLRELARRQGARHQEPYAVVLRLIDAIIGVGSATPQIADNGEGGIEVLWLVNGASLTIDYEDEFEILVEGVAADGTRAFAHTLTRYWTRADSTVVDAKRFLATLSASVARPLPLS
ncbi:hypothetical protein QT381_00705 [Galbitalea sp. SE-J8]|uniref:hypothetical protein n=1 Tax=Galbitalea sp. SE-J8 TaxID=3054952 RepID=UPI00259CA52A|nr:hypothetical protein [Galbitalea sp. SE-J8]MDM4761528.1 hypothetical protein [Galbitalea sp. SE-J8]